MFPVIAAHCKMGPTRKIGINDTAPFCQIVLEAERPDQLDLLLREKYFFLSFRKDEKGMFVYSVHGNTKLPIPETNGMEFEPFFFYNFTVGSETHEMFQRELRRTNRWILVLESESLSDVHLVIRYPSGEIVETINMPCDENETSGTSGI